jgi:hypothetical protein
MLETFKRQELETQISQSIKSYRARKRTLDVCLIQVPFATFWGVLGFSDGVYVGTGVDEWLSKWRRSQSMRVY